ncbi:MAG TPA: HAMP domain-containing sensor histidine kinase, partial [Candidatus Lokiarchaeia archaeon]
IIEILIKIYSTTDYGNRRLNFEFIDNGDGIPEYKKEYIFTRFKKDSNSVSGMGLGLSLVKTILDKYNAKIKVENKVKDDYTKGSIFKITFPISN